MTRLVVGADAIEQLPEVVAELGAQRVLLVCGRRSFEASGAARILPALREVATVTRWSEFRPNTDVDDLVVGLGVLTDVQPDLVLGVGGGSAMDMAKLLVAYAGVVPDGPATDPSSGVRDAIRGGAGIAERGTVAGTAPRLVLVPTTSGSGSEATHFAVVYLGADKHSVAGPALHADAVVLDPALSLSGSPHQRATSGIDAIAQAIESLWATGADDDSRVLADDALDHLLVSIVPYVNRPDPDPAVAHAMTLGAHLAGRAIDISRTTAPHALSYGLTKGYGLPHGHAVGVTLGAFVAAHALADPDQLQPSVDPAVHAATMASILDRLGAADPQAAHRRIDDLLAQVGLAPGLRAHGVRTAEDRARLARSVNVERLGNNPVLFDTAGLTAVLDRCG